MKNDNEHHEHAFAECLPARTCAPRAADGQPLGENPMCTQTYNSIYGIN